MRSLIRRIADHVFGKLGYQRKPAFPQAGVGSGVVIYRVLGPHHVRVGCASRSTKVGKGYGISFGGWLNLRELLALPPGSIITDEASALREGGEEVTGLFTVISMARLAARLHALTGFAVHVPRDPYGNFFHHGSYFGLAVTEEEERAIAQLPPSDETTAPLGFFDIRWQPAPVREDITIVGLPGPFHHKHEVHAFKALAFHLDRQGG